MALPRKTTQPNPGQITPISAVPHVSSDTLGGYLPPKSDTLSPSGPQDKVKKLAPTPENGPSTDLTCEINPTKTASDLPVGRSQEAKIEGSDEVSLPEFKVRTDVGPQKSTIGRQELSNVNDFLTTSLQPFQSMVLDAANRGTLGDLMNQVGAMLVQVVQLRWGCQRVTTKTKLGHWRGAPEQVDHRVVGRIEAEDRQADVDADMFAADIAFLGFLIDAREALAANNHPWADVQDRIETRLQATDTQFRAMAASLADLRVRFDKADAIQEAGGWPADKVPAAEAVLRHVTIRMAEIHATLERFRPDLLADVWPEARIEVAA